MVILLNSCQSNKDIQPWSASESNQQNDSGILTRPLPDERGIITYSKYQILIANGNETIDQIAQRLEIELKDFALYNGVVLGYRPRLNEVLALPVKIAGTIIKRPSNWSVDSAKNAISSAKGQTANKIGTPENPLRHRVEQDDTAYSVSRLYEVSVTALASWNGLDSDLSLIVGRELIIPVPSSVSGASAPPLSKPKLTDQPLKKTTEPLVTKVQNEPSKKTQSKNIPNESEIKVTASIRKPFIMPVSGKIIRGYNPSSQTKKNEGIDITCKPGTEVKASANGVVALVSDAVGSSGKIVLIRHENSYITIYAKLKSVMVSKGSRVTQGQKIGEVEKSDQKKQTSENSTIEKNYLHFEIRKGTKSIDPVPLLQ